MRFRYTPALSASPNYSDGDAMGGAAVQVTLPGWAQNKGVMVRSVHARDLAAQGQAIKLLFFKSNPEAASPTPATVTDNAAFEYGSAFLEEVEKLIIAAADWDTVGVATPLKSCSLGDINHIAIGPGDELWVLAIATGAFNAGTVADLTFDIGLAPLPE